MIKERICAVYVICNILNNDMYIGSSTDVAYRLSLHKKHLQENHHGNPRLQYAYNRYKNFIFAILERVKYKNLLDREQYWIDYYETYLDYNINPEAESALGCVRSKEFCRKVGLASIGRKHIITDEIRQRMSLSHIGNKHTNETKRKIGKNSWWVKNKGRIPKIIRDKISKSLMGHIVSEETRQKISITKRGMA